MADTIDPAAGQPRRAANQHQAVTSFAKGMNQDVAPYLVQPGQYHSARNAVQVAQMNANMYSLSNEEGFSVFSDFSNEARTALASKKNNLVIGLGTFDGKTVVFSVEVDPKDPTLKTKYSEIGVIAGGVYTTVLSDKDTSYWVGGITQPLGFDIRHQVDVEIRVNFRNNNRAYWTDGLNPPRFLDLDTNYRVAKIIKLESQTAVFPSYSQPKITLNSIIAGGALKVGVFQFVARYLTDSQDPTAWGFVCHPIPIVSASLGTTRRLYDGNNWDDPTLAAKSIKLDIVNIDIGYKALQVAVIFYNHSTSDPEAHIFFQQDIIGPTTTVIFDGGNLGEDVTLGITRITDGTVYSTAQHVIQKDAVLLFSNLTASAGSLSMQPIANGISLGYQIIEVPHDDGSATSYSPYRDEKNTFSAKGWMRNEIYSLGVRGILKNGSLTAVAHIPGNGPPGSTPATVDITAVQDGTQFPVGKATAGLTDQPSPLGGGGSSATFNVGMCGSAYATHGATPDGSAVYPLNSGIKDKFGADLSGQPIRHHQMPDLDQQPLIVCPNIATYPSQQWLRLLQLRFIDVHKALNANPDIRDQLAGIEFVYQPRDSVQSVGIFTQGIGIAVGQQYGSQVFIDPILNAVLMVEPLFGVNDLTLSPDDPPDPLGSAIKIEMYCNLGVSDTNFSPTLDFSGDKTNPTIIEAAQYRCLALYTPEDTFGRPTPIIPFSAGMIRPEVFIRGAVQKMQHTYHDRDNGHGFILTAFCDYNSSRWLGDSASNFQQARFQRLSTLPSAPEKMGVDVVKIVYQNTPDVIGDNYQDRFGPNQIKIKNPGDQGYLLAKIQGAFDTTHWMTYHTEWNASLANRLGGITWQIHNIDFSAQPVVDGEDHRLLYNIYNTERFLYGPLYQNPYIAIDQLLAGVNGFILGDPANPDVKLFNGDTFVTKFGVRHTLRMPYTAQSEVGGAFSQVGTAEHVDGSTGAILHAGGLTEALFYFPVESQLNLQYRHRPTPWPAPSPQGPPYYPRATIEEMIQPNKSADPALGHSKGYNIQYSRLNSTRKAFGLPEGFIIQNKFPTRTIFSLNALEGEQTDQWRNFKPLNFQDLPKNKGPITGQFVFKNVLWLLTERSLFKTFMNQVQMQKDATTSLETSLGTAAIFGLPPQEIFPLDGGYAGSQHKYTGTATPFGYVWADYLQRKVFLLNEGVEEISQVGLFKWFQDNLTLTPSLVSGNPNFMNNPANPLASGMTGHYDPRRKRYVLGIKDSVTGKEQSISFGLMSKSWASMHDYFVPIVTPLDLDNIAFSNQLGSNSAFVLNGGAFGRYFGTTQSFVIVIVINADPLQSKVMDVLEALADFSKDGLRKPFDFFTKGRFYNDRQNSDYVALRVYDPKAYWTDELAFNVRDYNNQYRIKVPYAKTVDVSVDLNAPSNLTGEPDVAGRMRGKFFFTELQYDNLTGNTLSLHSVLTKYRKSFR